MTFIQTVLGLRLGDIRESGETGDSREEEDTQWRQVITLYTRILRTFADSAFHDLLNEVATQSRILLIIIKLWILVFLLH